MLRLERQRFNERQLVIGVVNKDFWICDRLGYMGMQEHGLDHIEGFFLDGLMGWWIDELVYIREVDLGSWWIHSHANDEFEKKVRDG